MSLAGIDHFRVPQHIVEETQQALCSGGKQGFEVFVLWSGVVETNVFTVRTYHLPRQTGYKLESGLCVRVDGQELHRLNRWLYESGETLGVQIHSHPSAAYHSETDDAFPIVTILGGLSIVVPDFGRLGLLGVRTAMYRLASVGWVEVAPRQAQYLVDVRT